MVNLGDVDKEFREAYIPDTDILLGPYIDAFAELNKTFIHLGQVFKFVASDVEKKIAILKSKMFAQPEEYMSLQMMIEYEKSNDIINSDKENGCRTLLRLHRALAFVAHFIAVVLERREENLSSYVKEAYDKTLSKYHAWTIRKCVGAAMYTLPYRRDIICLFDFNPDEGPIFVDKMWDIYNLTERLYEKQNLLDLE